MTIRVYEPTHPPLRMSDLAKRKRGVLERKAVDKILIDEDQGIVFSPRTGTSIAWYSIETVWETISQ